jgi:hypothetical protein
MLKIAIEKTGADAVPRFLLAQSQLGENMVIDAGYPERKHAY